MKIISEESSPTIESKIIDKTGKPFKKSHSMSGRWKNISKKMKIIIISITAFITLIATLITNLGTIEKFINSTKSNVLPPNIVVKLSNSSKVDVVISDRGDFTLWFPGPGAAHTYGRYEFVVVGKMMRSNGGIIIPQSKTITLFAKILNNEKYSKVFANADCDINLIIYRSGLGLIHTNDIPFSSDAITKYYLEADVGK
jgi:hypothetical protein